VELAEAIANLAFVGEERQHPSQQEDSRKHFQVVEAPYFHG